MVNISLVIFFAVILLLFVPWSVNLNVNIKCKELFKNIIRQERLKNNVTIKLCLILPVYYKRLFGEKNKKKDSKLKKKLKSKEVIYELINKAYFNKFVLSVGINFDDYIANAYINATINTLLCLYINLNQDLFNLRNLYYQTYISDELLKINFKTSIKIRLIDFLIILFSKNKKDKNLNNSKIKNNNEYGYVKY